MAFQESPLVRAVIGCVIEVHRELGPGLLENAYATCLAHEFSAQGIEFSPQYPLPVYYKGCQVDCGYRADFIVGSELLLEIKSVDALLGIHQAQVLTYLKLSGIEHGLLVNFNTRLVKDGMKSLLLTRAKPVSP